MGQAPPVELYGRVADRYLKLADDQEVRIKLKPRPSWGGNPDIAPPSWPKATQDSSWLMPLPMALSKDQTLVTDGTRGWPKDKPPMELGAKKEESQEILCTPPEAISISSDPVVPITPHSTVTVTSVWNNFSYGILPQSQWGVGGWSAFNPGVPPPRFFWEVGNLPLTEGAKFQGVHTAILTIQDFTAADNQNYTVHANCPCGTVEQNIPLST